MPSPNTPAFNARIVACATLAYAVIYSVLGAIRYAGHRSGADLGLFVQTLSTPGFSNTLEAGNHFTYHFSPLLFGLVPILRVTQSPLALVVVQAIACALVAPPVFMFARKRMAEPAARAVTLLALLYPPLAGVTFTDFHENGFAPALVLWLIWAVDARRHGLIAVFAVLLLGVKEDEAIVLAAAGFLGAGWFAHTGERRSSWCCAGVATVAALTFVAYFAFVRPLAGAHDVWNPSHFYAWDRNGPGTTGIDARGRVTYVIEALAPLAFAPVASAFSVFAIPPFAEVLLSHLSITYTMGQHYAGVWIGWLLAAEVLAIARIARADDRRARMLLRTSFGVSLVVLAVASPTHWGHFLHLPNAEDRALDAISARLPRNAAVGTFDELYAHLGTNAHARIGLDPAPAYVIDDARYDGAAWARIWRPQLRELVKRGRYRAIAQRDGVTLFAMNAPHHAKVGVPPIRDAAPNRYADRSQRSNKE